MDDGVVRELFIGVAGGVITAALIALYTVGFQWTAKSREVARQRRESDIADWKGGDAAKRQRVFNVYLFDVLKLFIMGNIIIGVTNAVQDLEPNMPGLNNFDYIAAGLDAVGVLFYVATFGKILQFTKLVRQHP